LGREGEEGAPHADGLSLARHSRQLSHVSRDRWQIEAQSEDLQGKPENIVEKIVTGRVEKAIKTKLLMAQPYIRDTDKSVEDMVKGYIAKLGENIKVARFVRFNVGETAEEKPEEDFAAEVEKMKAGK